MAAEGTYKAYFRGNGANVIKNVPETALKLTCNDRVKAFIAKDGHTISFSKPYLKGAKNHLHLATLTWHGAMQTLGTPQHPYAPAQTALPGILQC